MQVPWVVTAALPVAPKGPVKWDREPPTPKASRACSKHCSCSRKRALSQTLSGQIAM